MARRGKTSACPLRVFLSTKVCLAEAQGLIHWDAIEAAKKIDSSFVQPAILNYAREEVLGLQTAWQCEIGKPWLINI